MNAEVNAKPVVRLYNNYRSRSNLLGSSFSPEALLALPLCLVRDLMYLALLTNCDLKEKYINLFAMLVLLLDPQWLAAVLKGEIPM